MPRYSRETENLEGVPVVYSIQSHDHLKYTVKTLVTTKESNARIDDVLCEGKNSEVNVHLSGYWGRVVAEVETCLVKTYEQLAFNRQVNGSLNDHGQYVESTV